LSDGGGESSPRPEGGLTLEEEDMTRNRRVILGLATVVMAFGITEASAQVIGTFRWQFAPFCNVVTLLVEAKGSLYELTGTDNVCGAPVVAAARGTAHVNPNGTASIALTIQRPDGIPVNVSATIDLVLLSGTWRDNFTNSGTFSFNPPAAPAGSLRPITLFGNYAVTFTAAAANARGADDITFGMKLPAAPAAPTVNFIQSGAAFTASCPGTLADPKAAPGHLCVYESSRQNVSTFCIAKTGTNYICGSADDTGASVFIDSTAAGTTTSAGRWVVTVP
jgi:hypothetical protein